MPYKSVFTLLTTLLCLLVLQQGAHAQTKGKTYTLVEVNFEGAPYLDHQALMLYTGLTLDQEITLPSAATAKAVKGLWDQHLFADVKLESTPINRELVVLTFRVKSYPRLGLARFGGVNRRDEELFSGLFTNGDFPVVNPHFKGKIEQHLLDYYAAKGYSNTSISISEAPNPYLDGALDLNVIVKRGKRIKTGDILFEGNQALASKKLRRQLSLKRKQWYIPFQNTILTEKKRLEDEKALLDYYHVNGHNDVTISSSVTQLPDAKHPIVRFNIKEGKRYFFRHITWEGNAKYSDEQLATVLDIRKGDVYDQAKLEANLNFQTDRPDVSGLYMDDGYLFFKAEPLILEVDGDSIDLEIRLVEGNRARINQVTIEGNTRTYQHVILREIQTKPGDWFRRKDLLRSQNNLIRLGFFNPEKVRFRVDPDPKKGTVDLTYMVEELPNDKLELTGSYGGNQAVGSLGVNITNFSTRTLFKRGAWDPIPTGDGQRLSISGQSSGENFYGFNVAFTEPWLGGKKPNALSVSAYYSFRSDTENSSLDLLGGSIGLGKVLGWGDRYTTFQSTISYQRYTLNDFTLFSFDNGVSNNFSITNTLIRNTVVNPIFPVAGSRVKLFTRTTLPYSAFQDPATLADFTEQDKFRWLEYYKIKFNAEKYLAITPSRRTVLYGQAGFGYLGNFSNAIGTSPFERFYLGGSGVNTNALEPREVIGLRGYPDLGVSSPEGDALLSKYTFEVRHLVSKHPKAVVYVLGFAEAGNSWTALNKAQPFQLRTSAGLGIRFYTPIFGTFGFDYGWGFNGIEGVHSAGAGVPTFTLGFNLGSL